MQHYSLDPVSSLPFEEAHGMALSLEGFERSLFLLPLIQLKIQSNAVQVHVFVIGLKPVCFPQKHRNRESQCVFERGTLPKLGGTWVRDRLEPAPKSPFQGP